MSDMKTLTEQKESEQAQFVRGMLLGIEVGQGNKEYIKSWQDLLTKEL